MAVEDSARTLYQRYDWNGYLDGKWRIFTQGEDFVCGLPSFRVAAHKAATVRGMIARTVIIRGSNPKQIKIAFFPQDKG